jgi:RHS repeat-associated protein
MKTHSHRVGIRTCSDYSPFGVELDGRTDSGGYRFGFQNQEKDDEVKGEGNSFDFGARILDTRIGRWCSRDPRENEYSWQSTYAYFKNSPTSILDIKGEGGSDVEVSSGEKENKDEGGKAMGTMESSTTNALRNVKITISGTPNGKTYKARSYPDVSPTYFTVPVYTLTISGTDANGQAVSQSWDVLRFMPFKNTTNDAEHDYKTIAPSPIMSGLSNAQNKIIHTYKPDYQLYNTYSPENGAFVIQGGFYIHDGPDDLVNNPGWGSAGCMEVCGSTGFSEMKDFIKTISGSTLPTEEAITEIVNAGKVNLVIQKAKVPVVQPVVP